MTNKELLQNIADIVRAEHEGKIMFADAITIKASPHSFPFYVYGAEIGPQSGVWLMTGEDWHKLEETDRNFSIVANSIIQRLKLISSVKS